MLAVFYCFDDKCSFVVIRTLCVVVFSSSLVNNPLLLSVTLISIQNEKDVCLVITARKKP